MGPFAQGAAWMAGAILGTLAVKLVKAGIDNIKPHKEDPHAPWRHHTIKLMATTTMARFDSAELLFEEELKSHELMKQNFDLLKKDAKEVLDTVNEYIAFSEETADRHRRKLLLIRESLTQIEEVLKTSMQAAARARAAAASKTSNKGKSTRV